MLLANYNNTKANSKLSKQTMPMFVYIHIYMYKIWFVHNKKYQKLSLQNEVMCWQKVNRFIRTFFYIKLARAHNSTTKRLQTYTVAMRPRVSITFINVYRSYIHFDTESERQHVSQFFSLLFSFHSHLYPLTWKRDTRCLCELEAKNKW